MIDIENRTLSRSTDVRIRVPPEQSAFGGLDSAFHDTADNDWRYDVPSPPLDSCSATDDLRVARWLEALEARQLANLKFAEVTRALRALSSAYVERRREGAPRAALDSAGKRAAFALFYAPLHFIATRCVVSSLAAHLPAPRHVLDLGCGTGVGGAAWALSAEPTPTVSGIDRHPWAVEETRWTYAQLGLRGRASTGSLPSQMRLGPDDAAIAAYVLNELPEAAREKVEAMFVRLAETGTRILVIEPISRTAVPVVGHRGRAPRARGVPRQRMAR